MRQKLKPYAPKELEPVKAKKFKLYQSEFKAGLNTVQIAHAHKTTEASVYNTLAKGGEA